ncbi:hypothetical protein GTI95_13470, partial [Citrobacter werkmanii]|nr:hypothetical protein [Citrobacter werkmanii]
MLPTKIIILISFLSVSKKNYVSISCPSCSATDGVVRNSKSTAGHQR